MENWKIGRLEEWRTMRSYQLLRFFISPFSYALRFTQYATRHASHLMFHTSGIIFFFCFTHLCIAAPPNPHLFYDYNPTTNKWTPKPRTNPAQFLNILQGCCLARKQGVLQSDGIEYVLAIKVDFSDQPGQRSNAEFNQFLFAENSVSLTTYYKEISYGQMDVQSGPMGGVIPKGNEWVRAEKPMVYYGEGRTDLRRYRELVREACAAVDDIVDFSAYDRDKDGVVDHVFVIHAGDDEALTLQHDDIWSILTNNINREFDGVRVSTAVVAAEEPSFDNPHLGIYFHEFFHDFGAPDVYGTGGADPRDHKWGLMGAFGPYQGEIVDGVGNGLQPSHIIGYLKWDFDARPENGRLGWIKPFEIKENVPNLSIPSFELLPGKDKLFKIDIPEKVDEFGNGIEFFLIENRYRDSGAVYDTHLPESGILIWHIDETEVRPPGFVNAAEQIWLEDPSDSEHFGIDPDNPDFINTRFITDGAAYSADDNQTSFTPATDPNSNANDGTVSTIAITNIGFEGQTMLISVSFGDTYEPNNDLETAFRIEFNQTYESFIFDEKDVRDLYQFGAIRGEAIVITLADIPETVDYQMSLRDASDRQIADGERIGLTEHRIVFRPEQTGTLYISVEAQSGFSDVDSYLLAVNAVEAESGTLKLSKIRAFPNPFRAGRHTSVTFDYIRSVEVEKIVEIEKVELEIFNIANDLVYAAIRQNVIEKELFQWNGKDSRGEPLASGIYIYVISATQGEETVRKIGKVGLVR